MTFALTMLSRRGVLSGSCAAMAALALPMIANAQGYVDENSRVVGGVLGYLGVLPAAMILGHPESHSEATMNGGATARRHQYHLVLALFDAASGARIETARVSVVIMGLGHTGKTRLDLDPMMIADTITWGTFVEFAGRDSYQIIFDVVLPDRAKVIQFPFTYAHSSG